MRHISAIVAMSENRCIGREGGLPWHIPEDLKRFKELTMGHAVLMGRNTYLSLPEKYRPLPGRLNIVASKTLETPTGVIKISNAAQFCQDFMDGKIDTPTDTLWVIGGGEIYNSTLKYFDEIYVTKIHQNVEGDTFFPEFEERYQETSSEPLEGLTFFVYHRIIPID